MRRLLPFLLVAGAVLAACGTSAQRTGSGATQVQVSVSQCGAGWTHATPGRQSFELVNSDTRAGEVMLTNAASGAVYADVEPLGPGTHRSLDIDLGSGAYAFRCAMEDEPMVIGATVRIAGHATGAFAVLPVSQGDLIAPTQAYESYVHQHLPTLFGLTRTLRDAVARGDLAAARSAWLPAHLEYERLGAAYGAFGELDSAINGRPDGLPGGVHDHDWAGFHRVEYGLWHGESASSLRDSTKALLAAVNQLGAQFAKSPIDPLDVSIRAHEISENALQFELTGATDYGSHSNLATVGANLDGTRAVLTLLRPLLVPRYAQLPAVTAELDRTRRDLTALRDAPLSSLSTAQREGLDADVSDLCELLAPVASILEPRRTS